MPAFARSADFALDKPAGTPCPNLQPDLRCGIHPVLRERGFAGCDVFDCFGAGQLVTSVFGSAWREDTGAPASALPAAFSAARLLSEALWHLVEAFARVPAGPLRDDVAAARERVDRLLEQPAELAEVEVGPVLADVAPLLRGVSAGVRSEGGRSLSSRDLSGADLAGADLSRADLRSALLIGADLRRSRLVRADLLGADLRGADLRGADLTDALFLTVPQLASARGDAATRVPGWLEPPSHW